MLAKWPPLKLAQLAFVGALVAAADCLSGPVADEVQKLPNHYFPAHNSPVAIALDILILLAPITIGALMALPARKRLLAGLEKQQWPDSEVERVRLWANAPVLSRAVAGLCALAVALWIALFVFFVVWGFRAHPTIRLVSNSLMFLMLPGVLLANLRQALKPERPPFDPSKSWARTMKPLRSDHWGESEIHLSGRAEA